MTWAMYVGGELDDLPEQIRGREYEVELAIFLLTILETYPANVRALADVMAACGVALAASGLLAPTSACITLDLGYCFEVV